MSNDKNLDKFLPPEDKNADNDYNYSRSTYYELVEKGKESLELMIEVARESEHPRAFEVLSGMIKNISDVNDRLMDLNKKKKDLDKSEEIKNIATTTNNLFVGSTAELQKILKKETDLVNVKKRWYCSRLDERPDQRICSLYERSCTLHTKICEDNIS